MLVHEVCARQQLFKVVHTYQYVTEYITTLHSHSLCNLHTLVTVEHTAVRHA